MTLVEPSTTSAQQHTLETDLKDQTGYQEIILVENLQSAFFIALSTLPKERSVLCSPNAPLALFFALHQLRMDAEYCDLRLDGTIESRFLERSVSDSIGAIVLSHHFGICSDTQKAETLCHQNSHLFLEDASQSFYNKRKSGASIVIFSLDLLIDPTLGEGSFLATDDPEVAATLRALVDGGYQKTKLWNYDLLTPEPKHHLSRLFIDHALKNMDALQTDALQIAHLQQRYLKELRSNRLIELPQEKQLSPYPLFPIALVPALFCPKEGIYEALREANIDVQVGNKPIYKTTAFKDDTLSMFGAEEIFKAQLLLPCNPELQEEDLLYIIENLQNVLETYSYRGCSF